MVGILVAILALLGTILVAPIWYSDYKKKQREEEQSREAEVVQEPSKERLKAIQREVCHRLKAYVLVPYVRPNSDVVVASGSSNEEEEPTDETRSNHDDSTLELASLSDSKPSCEHEEPCSICLLSLQGHQSLAKSYCRHVFHYECLRHWFVSRAGAIQDKTVSLDCPTCRQNFAGSVAFFEEEGLVIDV